MSDSVYNQKSIGEARELIRSANKIVITTHRSPDGDAIGSSLGLAHFLRKLNKEVEVIVPDGYPEFLHWLPGHEGVILYNIEAEKADRLIDEADLLFSLDYNLLFRTGGMTAKLESCGKDFILIDHHQQPGDYPLVSFSDTSASSTAEMIYSFIVELGERSLIDASIGACLYTGIMTDSGSFRFPNVSPLTHEIAAHLISIGVDHSEIHRQVYDNNLINRLQLVGYALSEKLVQLENCKAAYIILTREELNRFGFQPGDTEGLVNYALSLKGVNFAAFVREGSNIVKLSFRSAGPFDVNQFAREYFSGGGHKNAAGGAVDLPVEEVEQKLIETIKRHCHEMDY